MAKTSTESIRIALTTKQHLIDIKVHPRETYNDVIKRLLLNNEGDE